MIQIPRHMHYQLCICICSTNTVEMRIFLSSVSPSVSWTSQFIMKTVVITLWVQQSIDSSYFLLTMVTQAPLTSPLKDFAQTMWVFNAHFIFFFSFLYIFPPNPILEKDCFHCFSLGCKFQWFSETFGPFLILISSLLLEDTYVFIYSTRLNFSVVASMYSNLG